VVEPFHLLLDDLRHRVVERLCRCARVGRGDRYLRRSDAGVLGDRQIDDRNDATEHDENRQDPREDRAVDEEA